MIRIVQNILLIVCILSFPIAAYADGSFMTDYQVEYTIKDSGTALVTQKITLTNRLTNLYAKEYAVKLESERITHVIAYNGDTQLQSHVKTENGITEIRLVMNENVVGLGKSQTFTLRYENSDIAYKVGTIWEINIPGIENTPELGDYNVTITVPESFGKPAYVKPLPEHGYTWSKRQLTAGGINIAYGTAQKFDISAQYQLENTEDSDTVTEIALPPDTAHQSVTIYEITPRPLEVVSDADGNWLARYKIPAKTTLDVHADFHINVFLEARHDYTFEPSDISVYTKATRFWNSQFPTIQSLAKKYRTPREIYDYIVNTFTYNYERVDTDLVRKGAVMALENPLDSVCMDFTDVYIALLRANGIPARQAVGYAYTTNTRLRPLSLVTDVLHAWPEYFDSERNLWIPVDPTWSSTTGGVDYFDIFDFNHIVFAYNGIRDDYPYPAGAYKTSGINQKLVNVHFSEFSDETLANKFIDIEIIHPTVVFSMIPQHGTIVIKNNHGISFNNVQIQVAIDTDILGITRTYPSVPPFSQFSLPFSYSMPGFMYGIRPSTLSISVNGTTTQYDFHTVSLPIVIILVLFVIGIGIYLWNVRNKSS